MKRIVLLGAGHAHLVLLRALARQPIEGAHIELVAPQARQLYSGMVPGVVAGHYRQDQAQIDLPRLAQAAGVAWRRARAVALHAQRREIELDGGERIPYELLSLATGSQSACAIDGALHHAVALKPLEGLLAAAQRVREAGSRQGLQLAVVGAGAAGFEIVMALSHALSRPGLPRSRLVLVAGGGAVLPGYPTAVVRHALAALRRAGVSVLPLSCTSVQAGHLVLDARTRVPCDLAFMALGAAAPAWLRGSGLELDAQGFVATGPTLQSRSHPEVLASGDIASRLDHPHPRSGVHAVRSGPTLAHNLRALVQGQPLRAHRPPGLTLNLLSCGGKRAVAAWGRFTAEGAWVWHWKDAIDRGFIARMSPGRVPEAAGSP